MSGVLGSFASIAFATAIASCVCLYFHSPNHMSTYHDGNWPFEGEPVMAHRGTRVAVVGGGLGGLTLAIALRRAGVDAVVFERTPELREVGAAVAVAANSTRLLARLGLAGELAAVSTTPSELVFRDGMDGRLLVSHPIGRDDAYATLFGSPFYGLHRGQLQRILGTALGTEPLRLGRTVTGLRETPDAVVVEFEDGAEFAADVVVGADGVHSTVRAHVTDEQSPVYTRTSGFRGLVPVDALPSLPDARALQFWAGPDAHLLHYSINDGTLVNFLAVREGPAVWPTSPGPLDAEPGTLAAMFDGWHPAVREMVSAVPQSVCWPLYTQPPLRSWARGRAVLIGDAAHTMLPHHGQGANQAIEDAIVLAECLIDMPDGDHAAAFERYTRMRRARTRKIQRSSLAASPLLHVPNGPIAAIRDANAARFPELFGWIHDHDAAPKLAIA